jgi:hypothetical protein
MTNDSAAARRTVRLLDVPVALYREAQQHTDDVLRELVLMAGFEASRGEPGRASRLADTADRHRAERNALSVTAERHVAAATGRTITLEYDVEATSADTSAEWASLLDDIAALCREGTMLAVPANERVTAFSRWFCEEFVRQLRDGAEPRRWSEYAEVG